ncbi:MAG: lipoyltransferase, partial [Duncaniella sp.]|nr:lipoyltransferase [Duncaniella sp.]
MIPVLIPDMPKRPLAFYLAVEEWLAMQGTGKEYFMIWQVAPSVIIGRNQLLHREINPDFCREHSIEVFRRKSGGGAVFADRNNLMLS